MARQLITPRYPAAAPGGEPNEGFLCVNGEAHFHATSRPIRKLSANEPPREAFGFALQLSEKLHLNFFGELYFKRRFRRNSFGGPALS